jgi:hypothetical protein
MWQFIFRPLEEKREMKHAWFEEIFSFPRSLQSPPMTSPIPNVAEVLHNVSKNILVRLLGTRSEASNCITEPGPQERYREIFFWNTLYIPQKSNPFHHKLTVWPVHSMYMTWRYETAKWNWLWNPSRQRYMEMETQLYSSWFWICPFLCDLSHPGVLETHRQITYNVSNCMQTLETEQRRVLIKLRRNVKYFMAVITDIHLRIRWKGFTECVYARYHKILVSVSD